MTVHQLPSVRNQGRERLKLAIRGTLGRRNLDLVRNPFPGRVARALRCLGIDTVIDVGANIGQYGSALRAGGYRGRILSCEPLPDAFGRLRARARRDPRWEVVHRALGAESGTVELHVAANSYSSSILPMTSVHLAAAPGSDTVGEVTVAVSTVAELLTQYGISPQRTMLKVDTQGYENQVLDGAGPALSRFGAVQLELSLVPLYDGQELAGALLRRMDRIGFGLYAWDSSFNDPHTGRLLQADVLFAARQLLGEPTGVETAASEVLAALALAADR